MASQEKKSPPERITDSEYRSCANITVVDDGRDAAGAAYVVMLWQQIGSVYVVLGDRSCDSRRAVFSLSLFRRSGRVRK